MKPLRQPDRLILFCIAAIAVDFIPFLRLPFLWSETFFHEISHGLMAIATGGSIVSLTLNYDGSGHCISQGGVLLLVSFFGYFGSALWGFLIYLLADNIRLQFSRPLMALFIGVLLLTMLLWAENLSTYLILAAMITFFCFFYKFTDVTALRSVLQFIGIFVLLDAIRSPLALIDGRDRGDGAHLSDITFIPEFIWIGIWLLSGLSMLFFAYKQSYKC